jgi:hypothetical protein
MEDWSPNVASRDRRVPAGNDGECAQTVYRLDPGLSDQDQRPTFLSTMGRFCQVLSIVKLQ